MYCLCSSIIIFSVHTFHSPGGDFVLWVAGKVCQNQVKLSILCLTLSDCVMSLWDVGPASNSALHSVHAWRQTWRFLLCVNLSHWQPLDITHPQEFIGFADNILYCWNYTLVVEKLIGQNLKQNLKPNAILILNCVLHYSTNNRSWTEVTVISLLGGRSFYTLVARH